MRRVEIERVIGVPSFRPVPGSYVKYPRWSGVLTRIPPVFRLTRSTGRRGVPHSGHDRVSESYPMWVVYGVTETGLGHCRIFMSTPVEKVLRVALTFWSRGPESPCPGNVNLSESVWEYGLGFVGLYFDSAVLSRPYTKSKVHFFFFFYTTFTGEIF